MINWIKGIVSSVIAESKRQHGSHISVDVSGNSTGVKISRNSPCSCGSNCKYKKCCGKINK